MRTPTRHTTFILVAAFFLSPFAVGRVPCHAQPSDTIVANKNAWTLRHIWKVTGVEEQDRVGVGVGTVADLNNDSLADIAHLSRGWHVHYGASPAPSVEPSWVFEQSAARIPHPIPGHFRHQDSLSVGFLSFRWVDSGQSTDIYYRLPIFPVRNDSLVQSPELVWDPGKTIDSLWFITPNDFLGVNMDDEPSDELVMVSGVSLRHDVRSQVGEIWIYRGGPEFQVDTPTVVIRDQDENRTENQYYLHVADFDGDDYVDIALGTIYRDSGATLKFWFGSEDSPWSWTDEPNRVLRLAGTGLNHRLTLAHLNGDNVIDLAGTVYDGEMRYIHLYLSDPRRDFRTRSFAREDADRVLVTERMAVNGKRVGFLNDSTRRFEMLRLSGPSIYDPDEPMMLLFSGGENGPNATWDALYAPSRDGVTPGGVMKNVVPIPDCNGDGWGDVLVSDDRWWWDVLSYGIAMVLAGGPEIPNDDPTVSVREEPVAGEPGGLFLWPNPVVDELNIAWKGNLRHMPHRFAIHDVGGRHIASGTIDPYIGAARWRCADIPAGTYLLTAYDGNGTVIATAEVIKQ